MPAVPEASSPRRRVRALPSVGMAVAAVAPWVMPVLFRLVNDPTRPEEQWVDRIYGPVELLLFVTAVIFTYPRETRRYAVAIVLSTIAVAYLEVMNAAGALCCGLP